MANQDSVNTQLPYELQVSEYQEVSFELLEKLCRENDVEYDNRNFRWLGVKTKDGEVTNLGYLLSDDFMMPLPILRVDPANPDFLVESHFCKGSILRQTEETVGYLASLYGKNLFAAEEVYPLEALREAVLNLFLHRDYESPVRSMIKVWPDRLEFINGTTGEMLDGESLKLGLSLSKNPYMARIFSELHRSLGIGSGLTKIMEAYSAYESEPSFKILKNAFVLTLPNPRAAESATARDRRVYGQTQNLKVKEAIKLFSDSDSLTRKDVDDALGISQTRSSAIIRDLLAMDVIEKVGTGRQIRYRHKH